MEEDKRMSIDHIDRIQQKMKQLRPTKETGTKKDKTGWQRHVVSTEGVTGYTLSTGTHTLHPLPGEERQSV